MQCYISMVILTGLPIISCTINDDAPVLINLSEPYLTHAASAFCYFDDRFLLFILLRLMFSYQLFYSSPLSLYHHRVFEYGVSET